MCVIKEKQTKSLFEKSRLEQKMNPSDDFIFGPNDFGELNGSCQRCGVQYGSAAELKLHFATIHQRQTFECFVCNKLFLQKFNFLAHIDRVHPDLGKNFSCQYCDRVCVINLISYENQIHMHCSRAGLNFFFAPRRNRNKNFT